MKANVGTNVRQQGGKIHGSAKILPALSFVSQVQASGLLLQLGDRHLSAYKTESFCDFNHPQKVILFKGTLAE